MNVLTATTVESMVKNVLAVYYEALQYPTVVSEGMNWYADAHEFCIEQSLMFNTSVEVVAGVVAALSPGNRWDRNKLDAVSCLTAVARGVGVESFKSGTYGVANKEKAYRIARGEQPLDVLGGNKVRAFYLLIATAGVDSNVVCVDGHAVHIALGLTDKAINKAPNMSAKNYLKVADAYLEAAKYINSSRMSPSPWLEPGASTGVSGAQVQAVTWVMQRIKKGVVRPEV